MPNGSLWMPYASKRTQDGATGDLSHGYSKQGRGGR